MKQDLPDAQIIVDIKEPQTPGIEMEKPHEDVQKPGQDLGGTINVDIEKAEEPHAATGEIHIEATDVAVKSRDEDIKTRKVY